MSGQPYRYISDVANFRSDYMNRLNLQATIDDMNLKANQVYKASGQLPPQSSMPDTRSTAEKLADTMRLKVSIVKELEPIGGPQFGQMVIQEIERSNLNSNGALFVYLAQNIKELVRSLQKKYALGIAGNMNDAVQFRLFVENMYNETKTFSGSVQSAFNRPYSQIRGFNMSDIDAVKSQFNEISSLIVSKYGHNASFEPLIKSIHTVIDAINRMIPKKQQIEQFREEFLNNSRNIMNAQIGGPVSDEEAKEIMSLYNQLEQILEILPPVQTVFSGYEQLKTSLKNNNPDLSIQVLQNIRNMFPDVALLDRFFQDAGRVHGLDEFRPPDLRDYSDRDDDSAIHYSNPQSTQPLDSVSSLTDPSNGYASGNTNSTSSSLISGFMPSIGYNSGSDNGSDMSDVFQQYVQPPLPPPSEPYVYNRGGPPQRINIPQSDPEREPERTLSDYGMTPIEAQKAITGYGDFLKRLYVSRSKASTQADKDELDGHIKSTIESQTLLHKLLQDEHRRQGHSSGSGLKRGRGRPKGSGITRNFEDKVDTSKGIQPDRRYISFGKYLINNSKLNEGTVALRTPKGVNVIGYPSQRITPQLTTVFKKIVGGGVPSFKELTDLNDDERNYLYNVSKKAEILDKLSIPSPSKDQEDKDIHDFQVMKGEILSGNDNKDLIKKFKIHMSKMVRAGTLPKKEVADIMTDLIELGF